MIEAARPSSAPGDCRRRRIFVLNGPNLNLLGEREPELYGHTTFAELTAALHRQAGNLGVAIEVRQTNHEGVLIDWLHEAHRDDVHAVLLNAAAYTHTSVALRDAVLAIRTPVIEVHLTDPAQREAFRHQSHVEPGACAVFKGKGVDSYADALAFAAGLEAGRSSCR
ncbi:3-dehydroquinate dehydratase [Erythrobacteraceae bacterium CFH 75059]|uniref:type II 3-dehydroquinate dehydratase n=1 Tax=Qipengyuania thermophila TaxID=2509361 RepID=UPI0010220809|nr:type II 3-dehydroquinate dehydratase [Qipengyuania thermophila]TCD04989.1 3-dehydroquinate dehydratase [Erythrobacteraceae bacterium CFH 75059]